MPLDNFPLLQSLNILRRKLEQDVVGHLPAVVSFVQKELPRALEQSTTTEENAAIDSVFQQAMTLVRSILQKYLLPLGPHALSERVLRALILNFPMDDFKYASFWYPIWSLAAKFLFKNGHLLPQLEGCLIPKVESGCLDFRGKTGDVFMLGRTVIAFLKYLGRNTEGLSQDGIERLLVASAALQFDAQTDSESVELAARDLKAALRSETPQEFPSSFLSLQELCFKLFPFVIYFNSLGKAEQLDVAGTLLLDTQHVKNTRLLIAGLLVRTCSPNVLIAAHTLLDRNCLLKSANLARLLPLSLCTNELTIRDLVFDAFANIFGELSPNTHLQLKGHALEVLALLPQYASYLEPEIFNRLLISLSKHLDESRILECLKLLASTKLSAGDISALPLFSLFAQHPLRSLALKTTLFEILELCSRQATNGVIARFLCLQYICYYTARNSNLEIMERPVFDSFSQSITRFFSRECDRSFNHKNLLLPPVYSELPCILPTDWSLCKTLLSDFAKREHSKLKNFNDQKRILFQLNKLLSLH